jgi:hypothetical protein
MTIYVDNDFTNGTEEKAFYRDLKTLNFVLKIDNGVKDYLSCSFKKNK